MDFKTPDEMIKRIGGYLHRVVPVVDATGKVLDYTLKPLMIEFKPRDVMQVIVGASLLSIPVSFTEEVWVLGSELPLANVIGLSALSLVFIGLFVYYNFYRFDFKGHTLEFIKRVAGTYFISLLVVALLLSIINKCPWGTDYMTAIKRILIVAFPASMSAAVSDSIK
ncbi:hypothetical protein PDESU_06475 [Pontiella desulfatans]|uniref:DUF2391 domain-containing protein n=1 Tax=Pontiella desulfatans TaxID=2750659 RepID=A0A6C2UDF4_PONDE|nr:DUF2391 family protein [Pontiella desulfatans]VGO17873.1 hypothetical protein PDESU_06475 [Pontiella desulfatans]